MTPTEILDRFGPRESAEYDVVIVGGGPGGLSAAIRLKQLAAQQGRDVSVVVLEKGCEPGAHILSGAVFDRSSLTHLFPDGLGSGAPLHQTVTRDVWMFLGQTSSHRVPETWLPACQRNEGHDLVSLGTLTHWLAQQAEGLGVDVFAGFAAAEVLYGPTGAVVGVATGHLGLDKQGEPSPSFQLGMELRGRYTLLAEGSRGHLGRQVIARYALDAGRQPQSHALGVKEVWEIDPARHQPGLVVHTAGWPLDDGTYGGGFLYHMAHRQLALGLITGLDYSNPYLSPFEEFQRWKTHPAIRWYLEDTFGRVTARRLGYGARTITAGGLMSLPKLVFPGGALVGCDAGFLNGSRLKGAHAAIQSGMLVAEAAYGAIVENRRHDELHAYPERFAQSGLYAELRQARNFKSWFKYGLRVGSLMNGLEQRVFQGRMPWTLRKDRPDHAYLKPAAQSRRIDYPKPDGKLTFDRPSSVFLSGTNHRENQPVHLTLQDGAVPTAVNLSRYAGPEARYCPAGVYEFLDDGDGTVHLRINAANCLHCKACDIKDPTQNIVWVAPEGGGGPRYSAM